MTLPIMGTAPGYTLKQATEPALALGIALQVRLTLVKNTCRGPSARFLGQETHGTLPGQRLQGHWV